MPPSQRPIFEEILELHNAGDLVFLKSLLDAETIDYYIQGEHVAHYLFNSVPMRLMVRRDQSDRVRKMVADLKIAYAYDGLRGR